MLRYRPAAHLYLMMAANDAGSKLAPPTSAPSMSSSFIRAEILTAFGMTDDDIHTTNIDEHLHRYFTRKRAAFLPMNILSGDRHARAFRFFHCGREPSVRRGDDDVAMLDVLNFRNQTIKKRA